MQLELSRLSPGQVYRLMIQTIAPRPIAWVISDSGGGRLNLAPFSYFNGVTGDPPLVSISIGRKRDGSKKDTWLNIEERDDFVLHLASPQHAEAMTASAASLAHGESEIDACGLETRDLEGSRLPRLVGPQVAMACRKHQIVEVGAGPQALVLAEILQVWIDDAIATKDADGRVSIDPKGFNPLGRLGGNDYGTLGEVITVERPA